MTEKRNKFRVKIGSAIWKRFRREVLYLFEKKLADSIFDTQPINGINLKIIERDEFSKFAEVFKKLGLDIERIFDHADSIVVATSNGELVHWEFVAFGERTFVMEIERSIHIRPNSAYIYGGYTVPVYRGRGIATKVIAKGFDYLRENHFLWAYALMRRNNLPILRVMHKLSAQKIGVVTFIKLFNWKIYRATSEKKEDSEKLTQMFPSKKTNKSQK